MTLCILFCFVKHEDSNYLIKISVACSQHIYIGCVAYVRVCAQAHDGSTQAPVHMHVEANEQPRILFVKTSILFFEMGSLTGT